MFLNAKSILLLGFLIDFIIKHLDTS